MKKRLGMLFVVFIALFSLTSCQTPHFPSIENLMHPPMGTAQEEQIRTAFEKVVPREAYSLRSPTQGKYRSSYIFHDLNGDGVDEALVLYTTKTDEAQLLISVLSKTNTDDGYVVEYNNLLEKNGNVIDSIHFDDLDADGRTEIFISWNNTQGTSKKLGIYSYYTKEEQVNAERRPDAKAKFVSLHYKNYNFYDIFETGKNEKVCFIVTGEPDYKMKIVQDKVSIFSKENEKLLLLADTWLEINASHYISVKYEPELDGTPQRFFIDASKSDSAGPSMFTNVLEWFPEKGELNSIFNLKNVDLLQETGRTVMITTRDFNADGFLDIPTERSFSSGGTIIHARQKYFSDGITTRVDLDFPILLGDSIKVTVWNGIDANKKLKPLYYSVINQSDSYILTFPMKDLDNLTLIADHEHREWIVCEYNENAELPYNELYRISTMSVKEWDANKLLGYEILAKNDSLVYVFKFSDKAENYGKNVKWLNDNFKIIE